MEFDLIVIGAGPAGYTGAIRAAQLGMRVACIEKSKTLGGTCLNVGCIPSKALLHFSKEYELSKTHFEEMGIIASVKLDLEKMLARKTKIVSDLCKGIEGLFAKNKIQKITGNAKIIDANTVEVEDKKITAKNILIATGSEVTTLNGITIDKKKVISSAGALSLEKVPAKLVVIGGGYIGLELGSVWRRLGSEIIVVEYADRIVPALDHETGNQLHKILQKQGMQFKLGYKVEKVENKGKGVVVHISNNGNSETIEADIALVSVGRRPYTTNLGLDNLKIELDKQGRIPVNNHYQTNIPNVYAVGDVIIGPMLAHKAEEEAIAAVEIMSGKAGHVNYGVIPSVVYTYPEVASVGLTEEELKAKGIQYKVGKFPFLANSRARSVGSTDGFAKILADAKTDRVLGAHIIGMDAGNLIAEICILMEFGGSSEDLARTCHAHPTLAEAVREAALDVEKRAINF